MSENHLSSLPAVLKQLEHRLRLPTPLRRALYIIWVLIQDMIRCDLGKQASAMAYVTLLSLVPSLVAVFCVISLFTPLVGKDSVLIDHLRNFMLENLASSSGQAVMTKLDEMIRSLSLSKIGWSSFAGVLVTLILLLRQIEEALNRIWLVRKARNIFSRFMYFWTFLTLGMLIVGILVGATAGFKFSQFFSLRTNVPLGNSIISGLVAWGGGFIFFFFLYKIVPNCFVRSRDAAVGALVSSFVLQQGGHLYGLFVKGATNYQTLYGALAALPLFLTWLYICWIIILLGAVIAWRMEQGIPLEKQEDTLDQAKTSLEDLRNTQVRTMLPLVLILAIYQHFLKATGKGLSSHTLAVKLKLPTVWVCEALEVLQALGYIVSTRPAGDVNLKTDDGKHLDSFFPALPAATITVGRLQADLSRPLHDWLSHWHYDFPLDLNKAIQMVAGPDYRTHAHLNLQDALATVLATSQTEVRLTPASQSP